VVRNYYLGLKEAYEYRHLSLGRHTIAHAQPLMFRTTIYTLVHVVSLAGRYAVLRPDQAP